jgi:RimJ/RimL family protein N-acetyltransferase
MAAPAVRLRPIGEADLETLHRIQADPAWSDMVGMPSRDREDFLAHQRRVLADPANLTRATVVDGAVVGSIATFPVGEGREVGYSIDRAHWGRGIATAALLLVLEEDPRRPIGAGAAAHNVASRRVLEKAGFVETGVDESDGFVLYELAQAGGRDGQGRQR